MIDFTLLGELQRYVRFSDGDREALADFLDSFGDAVPEIASEFYARILEHPDAARVLSGGDAQLARLKRTLAEWLVDTLRGPWDADYLARHARIGRRHVEVGLAQHYMFVAVALIRRQLCDTACSAGDPDKRNARVHAINKLLDLELAIMLHTYREDYSAEVRERERHALVTQLLPTVARELHNPLTIIDSSAYLLQEGALDGQGATAHLEKIRTQARRASRIADGLLELARQRKPVLRPTSLRSIIDGVSLGLDRHGSTLRVIGPEPGPSAAVDPQYAEEILRHLLRNAFEAADGGEVLVELDVHDGHAVIRVSDDGPGIPTSIAERVFQPLTTTKSHGAGLGLALSRALAEAQGGRIQQTQGALPGACLEWVVGRAVEPDPGTGAQLPS